MIFVYICATLYEFARVGLFYVPTQADEPSKIAVPAPIPLHR